MSSTRPASPPPDAASFQISRRSFLRRCSTLAAATGLPLWFLERELGAAETKSPTPSANDRPGIALIGCGGQGTGDTTNAANHGDIVAVCDVDERHLAKVIQKFTVEGRPPPQGYSDFRRLLERKDVQLVINSTPDHWHTLINIAAARAGKDIYSQKPLTLTVDEGRHVIRAVRENKRILQTGTQQRSSQRFRLACELVRNGRIGKLVSATAYLPAGLNAGPFTTATAPQELNWDFWQGQTPHHDYVPERGHKNFRFWYEYSGGTMTDWGAHHNDIAYWAIGLLAPERVASRRLKEPTSGGYTAYSDYEVDYTYANGVQLKIRTTPDDDIYGGVVKRDGQRNGIRFEGTTGWIWVNRSQLQASDKDLLTAPLPEGAERLPVSNNHMANFVESARSRQDPICTVEIGHRSATMCHLGAISLRTGHALRWDAQTERFVGDHAAEANTYLAREMRRPYDYSFVA
jgi:predicted dehydrogenase